MESHPSTARPRPFAVDLDTGAELSRMPPHDLTAEAGVIGSMMIDPECIGAVCAAIDKPERFYDEKHQVIFRTIVELYEANAPIDGMIIFSTLRTKGLLETVGGRPYIEELINSVPSSAHAEYYAGIVREKAMLRGVIVACTETLKDAYDGEDPATTVLDRGEKRIFTVRQMKLGKQADSLPVILQETFEQIDRANGERLTGIPTGLIELDNLTSGLQRGEMIVVAARPSVGKTALAMGIAEHVGVDLKMPVAVFSLEMSNQQLAQRMLCSRSGVNGHALRRGLLNKADKDKLAFAVGDLSQGSIFIDDTPSLSLMDFRGKCRRLKLQHGIELIVLDYLQLMEAPGARNENRQQEISTISRGVKAIARELKVPVIALSQLNRASESEQRLPRTSDLRESGAIEQDADVIMLMHREAVMHRGDQEWMDANPDKINEALVIVAKQRNGPCDTVKLTYLSGCTRFVTYNPGV